MIFSAKEPIKTIVSMSIDMVTTINYLAIFTIMLSLVPNTTNILLVLSKTFSTNIISIIERIFFSIEVIKGEAQELFGTKAVAYFFISTFLVVLTNAMGLAVQVLVRSALITVIYPFIKWRNEALRGRLPI